MAVEMQNPRSESVPAAAAPDGRRLLSPHPLRTLAEHLEWYGALPEGGPATLAEVERSGLRGKGGARFPTATKLAAVAGRRRPIVIANGSEGEPASLKDTMLMSRAPHLVLDGAALAAEIVGAREIIVCITRGSNAQTTLERAIEERRATGYDAVPVRLVTGPHRYVSGEETAIVNWLNGGDAKPTVTPPRPFERGVDGRPTLVQNVETLGDLALIGRFGADWFRSAGTADDPGTTLITMSGGIDRPGVYEMPLGARLSDVVDGAGVPRSGLSALLVGGYFGAWIPAERAPKTLLTVGALQQAGAGLGAGVVLAMPREGACGLAESARVTRWLANENAGQCGPCVNGLDAIAGAMQVLVAGDRKQRAEAHLTRWLAQVQGRGACKHPDGVARFVASSLRVFSDEIARHRHHGPCPASASKLMPTPVTGEWR
jgi:NADH:ubiquinone oxidoreductase subunit F (NADH-binding)